MIECASEEPVADRCQGKMKRHPLRRLDHQNFVVTGQCFCRHTKFLFSTICANRWIHTLISPLYLTSTQLFLATNPHLITLSHSRFTFFPSPFPIPPSPAFSEPYLSKLPLTN